MKTYKKHVLWEVKTRYTDRKVIKSKKLKVTRYKNPFKEGKVRLSKKSELYTDYFSDKNKAKEYLNS